MPNAVGMERAQQLGIVMESILFCCPGVSVSAHRVGNSPSGKTGGGYWVEDEGWGLCTCLLQPPVGQEMLCKSYQKKHLVFPQDDF